MQRLQIAHISFSASPIRAEPVEALVEKQLRVSRKTLRQAQGEQG